MLRMVPSANLHMLSPTNQEVIHLQEERGTSAMHPAVYITGTIEGNTVRMDMLKRFTVAQKTTYHLNVGLDQCIQRINTPAECHHIAPYSHQLGNIF